MKIITLCGSLKYQKEMQDLALKLSLEGNCVLTPIYFVETKSSILTKEEKDLLGQMHQERIKISDAIYVVNVNNYIGSNTAKEIEFAQSLNKEILYYIKN